MQFSAFAMKDSATITICWVSLSKYFQIIEYILSIFDQLLFPFFHYEFKSLKSSKFVDLGILYVYQLDLCFILSAAAIG